MSEKSEFCCEAVREIDLVNMAAYLLRRWRSLMVAIMFGILLGAMICVIQREPVTMSPEQAVLEGAYVAPLEVQNRMKQAIWYRQLYERQAEYLQESYIMQMDSNKVYTGIVEYYLSAGNETRLLGEKLESILKDEKLLSEIREIIGSDKASQYLQEVLGCSVEINDSFPDSRQEADLIKEAVVTYTVSFGDRYTCNSVLQAVQNKVEESVEEYRTSAEIQRFEKIDDYIEIRSNSDFMNRKKSNTDNANTYATNYAKIEGEFNANPYDAAYYNIFYLGVDTTGIEAFDVNARVQMEMKAIIKWLFVGVFLTVGMWGIFHVIRYLLDGSIRTSEELKRMYGLNILGNVASGGMEKNPVDRLLKRWSEKFGMSYDSPAYLKNMLSCLEDGNFVMCGNICKDAEQMLKEKILTDAGIQMVGFAHQDENALQRAKRCGKEIIIVQKEKTLYQEIKRELEIDRMHNICVLGVLVVE